MHKVVDTILKTTNIRQIHEANDDLKKLKIFQTQKIDIIFTNLIMQPMNDLAFIH